MQGEGAAEAMSPTMLRILRLFEDHYALSHPLSISWDEASIISADLARPALRIG
jgi:hypothetical protein